MGVWVSAGESFQSSRTVRTHTALRSHQSRRLPCTEHRDNLRVDTTTGTKGSMCIVQSKGRKRKITRTPLVSEFCKKHFSRVRNFGFFLSSLLSPLLFIWQEKEQIKVKMANGWTLESVHCARGKTAWLIFCAVVLTSNLLLFYDFEFVRAPAMECDEGRHSTVTVFRARRNIPYIWPAVC